jgi:quercetin dioxygenase-like cupin family protein
MPRKWTKAQREAQSRRATAYWAKVRADNEAKERAAQARSSFEPAAELPWWRRVMIALGFHQGT